jgi:cysteine desulfurase / selenocysteine lyase
MSNIYKKSFEIFANYKKKNGQDLIYLDNASTSLVSDMVIDQISKYYKNDKSNTDRGLYNTEINSSEIYNRSRSAVADFLNVNQDEIIFTCGSSSASNDIVRIFEKYYLDNKNKLLSKNKILISKYAHNSDLLPLQEFASRNNLELIICDSYEDFDKELSSIDNQLLLVSHTLVSNVTGEIFDVKDIFIKCNELNIFSICDATSAVGKMRIDMREIGATSSYFSAHKMYGPSGVGVAYISKLWLSRFSPVNYGGGMVSEVGPFKSYYRSDIKAYEAGSPNVAGAYGLATAIDYIKGIGLENIKSHSEELIKYLLQRLTSLNTVVIINKSLDLDEINLDNYVKSNIGIVSLVVEGVHSHDVAEYLASKHVCIRSGHMCAPILLQSFKINSVCRVSVAIYNTKNDIDELILGLQGCVDKFKIS